MTLNQLWTVEGLLRPYGARAVQLGAPFVVEPSILTSVEPERGLIQSGLVELTVRIGLECLFVPTPVMGKLFVTETPSESWRQAPTQCAPIPGQCALSPAEPEQTRAQPPLIGLSPSWLEDNLHSCGVSPSGLREAYQGLAETSGLLWVSETGALVVTAKTAWGLLSALRALASNHDGRGLPTASLLVVPAAATPPNSHSELPPAPLPHGGPQRLHTFFSEPGDVQVSIPADPDVFPAILDFTAKLGIERTASVFPITVMGIEQPRQTAHTCVFAVGTDSTPSIRLCGPQLIFAAPDAAHMNEMLSNVTHNWFEPPTDASLTDWRGKMAALSSPAPDIRARARLETILSRYAETDSVEEIEIPAHLHKVAHRWASHHHAQIKTLPETEQFHLQWKGKSEWERMLPSLVEHLQTLKTRPLEVEVFTTVSKATFTNDVETFLERGESAFGLPDLESVQFMYRNVTKPGLDWFRSEILPVVKASKEVEKIEISAQQAPSDADLLDLPQRFLQEFFPVDAIVERETHLTKDAVVLSLHDVSQPMYVVTLRAANNTLIHQWTWESPTKIRPYMPGDTSRSVIVSAAGYRISNVAETGLDAANATATMQSPQPKSGPSPSIEPALAVHTEPTVYHEFWDWYQQEVLSRLIQMDVSVASSADTSATVFARLEAEVWTDGTDERLGIYEEVISWPEALHEDIYFDTLHALREHGERTNQPIWRTPGLIVPLIHIAHGAPRAEIRVFGYPKDDGVIKLADGRTEHLPRLDRQETSLHLLTVTDVAFDQGTWKVVAVTATGDEPLHEPLQAQLLAWLNEPAPVLDAATVVAPSPLDPPGQPLPTANDDIRVLQNNDVIQWLNEHHAQLPGKHWLIDHSFQGRPIVGVELVEACPEGLTSRTKHNLFKPTILILARHHANEVSSTNSAMNLIANLCNNPEPLSRFNVVIVPVHNTDGAALHRELMTEHRYWKHHAARFNACGYEFGQDYFKSSTQFGESRVAQRLWELWQPDLILDDHGIPSHEWVQPFAGYNSPPTFPVSYWIPHAQIYMIWRELQPDSVPAQTGLVQTVSRVLAADAEIRVRNAEFLQRYVKWGQTLSPENFPLSTVDGVITYRWPAYPSPQSSNFISRYPELVTADIVTEVNDETVHDHALYEVVHAHSKAHEGIFEWLANVGVEIHPVQKDASDCHDQHETVAEWEPAAVQIGNIRQRPLKNA